MDTRTTAEARITTAGTGASFAAETTVPRTLSEPDNARTLPAETSHEAANTDPTDDAAQPSKRQRKDKWDSSQAASDLSGEGVTGKVRVDASFVSITRNGFHAKAISGSTRSEYRISIASITAVQFKKPGLAHGYIQFTVPGSVESRYGGIPSSRDESSVFFDTNQCPEFEAIRDYIEAIIMARTEAAIPTVAAAQQASAASEIVTQLRELAKLRDEGILTDGEFAAQKAKLLA